MSIRNSFGRPVSRRTLLQASGAATLLALVGCSPQAGPTAQGTPTSGGAKRGGTVVVAQTADILPASLVGHVFPNSLFRRLVFSGLTEYDHKTLEPKPNLATGWQITPDATSITLDLRKDVKFHSGRPFGPQDVAFSIQQIQDPKRSSQLRLTASAITDMSASGPNQLKLRLAHPMTNLFDLFELMIIVDSETFPDLLTGKNVVGTGPFVWKTWVPGQSLSLTRNPSYWREGLPYLDGVEVRVIPQAQALLASVQARQTTVAFGLTPKDAVSLKNDPQFTTEVSDSGFGNNYYVGCNVKVPPFDRKEVRQAVAWAIDRERILKSVFTGLGYTTSIPWGKASPAVSDAKAAHYSYDPAKAKALLASAGVTRIQTDFAHLNALGSIGEVMQIVQFDLEQVGISTKSVSYDTAQFVQRMVAGTLPGLFTSVHAFAHLHPATLVLGAFPFNFTQNASNFASPTYTDLSRAAWTAPNLAAAKPVYQKLTDFMLDEQFVVQGVFSPTILVYQSKLKGIEYDMADDFILDAAHLAD